MTSLPRLRPLHPLQHNREILLAAMRELLGLADDPQYELPKREAWAYEATRLGLRLLALQKRIEELDLD